MTYQQCLIKYRVYTIVGRLHFIKSEIQKEGSTSNRKRSSIMHRFSGKGFVVCTWASSPPPLGRAARAARAVRPLPQT